MKARAALLILLAALRPQDPEYALELRPKPRVGWKVELSHVRHTVQTKSVTTGDRVRSDETDETITLKAIETVLRVRDGEPAQVEWYFSRATRVLNGKESSYGFEGRTVIVRFEPGRRFYLYEDASEIKAADLECLSVAFPSGWVVGTVGRHEFSPPGPVKAGASWTLDPKRLLPAMADSALSTKATGSAVLKSVAVQDGVAMATVTASISFGLTRMAGHPVDEAVPDTFTAELEFAADGSRPDGRLSATETVKGTRVASDDAATTVSADLKVEATITRRGIPPKEPDRSYSLLLDGPPPAAGAKQRVSKEELLSMAISTKMNGTVIKEDTEGKWGKYAGVVEVLEAKERMTFATARHAVDGKLVAWPFEGKAVLVEWVDGRPRFTREDGEDLSADERAALLEARDVNVKNEKKASKAAELFKVPDAIKVGESWKPDAAALAKEFDSRLDADPKTAKAEMWLVGVETRGGHEFGRIVGSISLETRKAGPLELEKPMAVLIEIDLDVCIDGKLSDGQMKVQLTMKGSAVVTPRDAQGPLDVDLDVKALLRQSRWTVK